MFGNARCCVFRGVLFGMVCRWNVFVFEKGNVFVLAHNNCFVERVSVFEIVFVVNIVGTVFIVNFDMKRICLIMVVSR